MYVNYASINEQKRGKKKTTVSQIGVTYTGASQWVIHHIVSNSAATDLTEFPFPAPHAIPCACLLPHFINQLRPALHFSLVFLCFQSSTRLGFLREEPVGDVSFTAPSTLPYSW